VYVNFLIPVLSNILTAGNSAFLQIPSEWKPTDIRNAIPEICKGSNLWQNRSVYVLARDSTTEINDTWNIEANKNAI